MEMPDISINSSGASTVVVVVVYGPSNAIGRTGPGGRRSRSGQGGAQAGTGGRRGQARTAVTKR